LICILYSSLVISQYDAFTFQSLLLDASLDPIANASISIRTSISSDVDQTDIYYLEEQKLISSPGGTIAFSVGSGVAMQGSFADIDWLVGVPYITVSYNLIDGQGWQELATTQFGSVPFCLESKYIYCQDGPQGDPGQQGPQGAQGPPAPTGQPSSGPQGPQGYQGSPAIFPLSTPPTSPQEGRVYLDDGTNTGDGNSGFRYYDGNAWMDL